jgi:hypothetical protein
VTNTAASVRLVMSGAKAKISVCGPGRKNVLRLWQKLALKKPKLALSFQKERG